VTHAAGPLACLVVATTIVAAQDRSPSPTFRTRSEGVRLEVLVTDGAKPIVGLTARDFELKDSGVDQVVEAASVAQSPVDVILVLDISTSLRAEGLAHLQRAAQALLARLQPRDRAGLVTFSQGVTIRAGITSHSGVREALADLEVQGSTSVVDAVYTGMLLQSDVDRPTLLLVFSDGMDTASWLRADAVLDTARRSGVVPYAVVTGTGVSSYLERPPSIVGPRRSTQAPAIEESERFLWELVRAGGGVFLNAESSGQLDARFTQALDSFRQRYILTYMPRGIERQGWHPLTIKIKGHRYHVRARAGYFVQ
jgi:VWFA-related protein